MRHVFKKLLSEEQLQFFKDIEQNQIRQDLDHPEVEWIVRLMEDQVGEKFTKGYWRIESKPAGHDWHYDGCTLDLEPNHMPWCRYSMSVLISDPNDFIGGVLELADPDESFKDNMQGSGVMFSSASDNEPVLHRATPHRGNRTVLLIFVGS